MIQQAYPVRGLGRATAAGIAAVLVVGVVDLLFNGYAVVLVRQARDRLDPALIDQAGRWWQVPTLYWLQNLLLAITAVVALSWCYQARRNLDVIPDAAPRFGPVWTVLGWFVPVVNLVLPALAVDDLAKGSAPADRRLRVLVRLWWAALLLGEGGALVLVVVDPGPAKPPAEFRGPAGFESYVDYMGWNFWWSVPFLTGTVVAGLLFMVLVLRISRAQHTAIPRLDTEQPVRVR